VSALAARAILREPQLHLGNDGGCIARWRLAPWLAVTSAPPFSLPGWIKTAKWSTTNDLSKDQACTGGWSNPDDAANVLHQRHRGLDRRGQHIIRG
jgi:hypothetical protein